MKGALDVHYDDARSAGIGAAVVFDRWGETSPVSEYTARVANVGPYVPGEFYRRELPVLLAVLRHITEPLELIVVDSYVQLGDKPGLGQHLHANLPTRIPVVGVAKTRFHDAPAVEVLRGQSKSPLYVTAIGIDPAEAAEHVRRMHGEFRIPELLKRVDRLCRDALSDHSTSDIFG